MDDLAYLQSEMRRITSQYRVDNGITVSKTSPEGDPREDTIKTWNMINDIITGEGDCSYYNDLLTNQDRDILRLSRDILMRVTRWLQANQ